MNKELLTKKLELLSDDEFIKFFRNFLDKKQYSYPDHTLIEDRDNAIMVLLADVSLDELSKALDTRHHSE